MIQNNNEAIIKRLATRKLRTNRRFNLAVVIAIALTGALCSALFTMGVCTLETLQYYGVHQAGTRAHAILKSVTRDQADKLKGNPNIREIGCKLFVADSVDNSELANRPVEMSYMDEAALSMNFSIPVSGKRPQKENEIIVDTATLDQLGIPAKTGVRIPIAYTVSGKQKKVDFVLSGWWQSEPRINRGDIVVSKAYVDSYASELSAVSTTSGYRAGTIDVGLYFDNAIDIDRNLQHVLSVSGYDWSNTKSSTYIRSEINPAYSFLEAVIEPKSISVLIGMLLLVISACYLMLSNTLRIFVRNNTHFYGMLKTLGTTGNQLHRLVRRQILLLAAIGLPCGLIAGLTLGEILASVALTTISTDHMAGSEITFTLGSILFIAIGSVLIPLLTVFLGMRKPCRMAKEISSVESIKIPDKNPEQK